jgi:5-methyltetrahydrofolate--homocysteine methyltransferase
LVSTSDAGIVKGRPIVIATVKGDIHDIGKNIVRALLENYGFTVIDLGRDVPPEKIVEAAKTSNAMMVGLSALMTTTVGAMAETVKLLKMSGLDLKTCVGGAVVTQEYADEIGADYYAKDAMRTVRIAEILSEAESEL